MNIGGYANRRTQAGNFKPPNWEMRALMASSSLLPQMTTPAIAKQKTPIPTSKYLPPPQPASLSSPKASANKATLMKTAPMKPRKIQMITFFSLPVYRFWEKWLPAGFHCTMGRIPIYPRRLQSRDVHYLKLSEKTAYSIPITPSCIIVK